MRVEAFIDTNKSSTNHFITLYVKNLYLYIYPLNHNHSNTFKIIQIPSTISTPTVSTNIFIPRDHFWPAARSQRGHGVQLHGTGAQGNHGRVQGQILPSNFFDQWWSMVNMLWIIQMENPPVFSFWQEINIFKWTIFQCHVSFLLGVCELMISLEMKAAWCCDTLWENGGGAKWRH